MTVTPVGTEFLVNTTTYTAQSEPTITRLDNRGFVVSWTDSSGQGGDASYLSIKAQIYSFASIHTGTSGADTLVGGSGDDTFHVNHQGDTVTETAGGGHDTVRSTLASYVLPAHVENSFSTAAAKATRLTTPSSAMPATTSFSVEPATTSSMAARATTC